MNNLFEEFNKKEIEQIKDFYYSQDDILLFEAPSGSGKSKIIDDSLSSVFGENFIFYLYGSRNSVIEDFLLSFYDTLRNYSIQKKITLKKDVSDNFAQKVSNYMKLLPNKTIIIVDNFEKIKDDIRIVDFLINLSKIINIKLILLSRDEIDIEYFTAKQIKIKKIVKEVTSKEDFLYKIGQIYPDADFEALANLYDVADRNTILISATFDYIKTTGLDIRGIIREFDTKPSNFADFITAKLLSIMQQGQIEVLKILSFMDFLAPLNFVQKYNLGNLEQIEYLKQKNSINQKQEGIYTFEHIRKYFISKLSAVEKLNLSTKLIKIYNEELTKSPKNRFLRLSREGIRERIENLEKNIPNIKTSIPKDVDMSYYLQSQETEAWIMPVGEDKKEEEKQTLKIEKKEDISLLKKVREVKYLEEAQKEEENKNNKIKFLNEKIKEKEANYEFENAIYHLLELLRLDHENKNYLYKKIAKNYSKINKKEEALQYYIKIADNYKNEEKNDRYFEALLDIARTKQDLYKLNEAEEIYEKIYNLSDNQEIKAQAVIKLGEVLYRENNKNDAIKNYNMALNLTKDPNKICEINYLTAILYEGQKDFESAKKYYKNAIEIDNNSEYLAFCYLNLALILADEGNNQEAITNFEKAIEAFKKAENINYSSLYFANLNMSYIYKQISKQKQKQYLDEALTWAIKLDDSFELTNIYVELGDYYYNSKENKEALLSYLKAQSTLKEDETSQNHQMILMRIEDMKYKLGEDFDKILNKYERQDKNN